MKKTVSVLLLVLSFLVCFNLSGCSTEPDYYSEAEVKQYVKDVFGGDYKLVDKLTDNSEKNLSYEYVFKNSRGDSFSVFTSTSQDSIDASPLPFYSKNISDNYIDTVIKKHTEKITETCEKYNIAVEFNQNQFNNHYLGIEFYLQSYIQLEKAAQLIAEVDKLLSFEFDYSKTETVNTYISLYGFPANIYIKPDAGDVNNLKSYLKVSGISFSSSKFSRLSAEKVYETIECDFADTVKKDIARNNAVRFTIPDELLSKYPAPDLYVSVINGRTISEPYCSFHRYGATGDYFYIMSNIFPCNDYDKSSDIPHKFANMVENLGGEYKCENSKAKWEIDGIIWTAEYDGNKKTYDGFSVKRDGKELTLSKEGDEYSRVSSCGRGFTPNDLEKLLNVNVIIDRRTMTAEIAKK